MSKIAISLPRPLLASARRAVREGWPTTSAPMSPPRSKRKRSSMTWPSCSTKCWPKLAARSRQQSGGGRMRLWRAQGARKSQTRAGARRAPKPDESGQSERPDARRQCVDRLRSRGSFRRFVIGQGARARARHRGAFGCAGPSLARWPSPSAPSSLARFGSGRGGRARRSACARGGAAVRCHWHPEHRGRFRRPVRA